MLGEVVVEAGQASVDGHVATAAGWAALVAAMLLAAALWWLYFDSAAAINLKVLELSGGSPTMARAIFAVGHMLPAFALLITAAGVGLLLEDDPPRIAYWLACVGAGMYLAGTRAFLVSGAAARDRPSPAADRDLPARVAAAGADAPRLPVAADRLGGDVRRADDPDVARRRGRARGPRALPRRTRSHAALPAHRIAPMSEPTKFLLGEGDVPTHWVNLMAELPGEPLPPLSPRTGEPAGPEDLTPIFPLGLIQQEVSAEPEIEIPEAVRDAYGLWRPTPLYRARRLERALDTPAHIFYKYEGVSPAGSHKPNTAVPQAYENAQAGIERLATETGAGQWGSALAFACSLFGLGCEVFMVGSSYDQKPYRRSMMETWGATVHRSPLRPDASPAARRPSTRPARWASRSPRRSRSPPRDGPATTRSARCSTTCCCTRP